MKIATIIIAAALAIPAASSFAQSQPVTRAQVKAELVQLERAGYNPAMDRATYPAQIQAAEAKVAAENGQTSYGGVADGRRLRAARHTPATASRLSISATNPGRDSKNARLTR